MTGNNTVLVESGCSVSQVKRKYTGQTPFMLKLALVHLPSYATGKEKKRNMEGIVLPRSHKNRDLGAEHLKESEFRNNMQLYALRKKNWLP